MDRQHGDCHFWTTFVRDCRDGFVGLQLHQECRGNTRLAAKVLFWDACGQFYVETFGGDVPVVIIEALIAETKEQVYPPA